METILAVLGDDRRYRRMMRSLFCLAILLAPLATDASGDDRLKAFMNVSAPQTALNAPVVFTLNGKTCLVGLYYRESVRDVSAMVLEGKNGIHLVKMVSRSQVSAGTSFPVLRSMKTEILGF